MIFFLYFFYLLKGCFYDIFILQLGGLEVNIFMSIRKSFAISSSILIFLLIVALVFLYSGKSLVNRENLSDYIEDAEILNMDVNVIFNLEESGITLKEKIYQLGLESNIPENVLEDIISSKEINIIFGDFFSNTINYLVNGLNKPQLSNDSINKLIEVANISLEDHINLMMEQEQLEEYVRNFCNKLTDIVPERYEVIGDLPITSIQMFLNFDQTYLYLVIIILLVIIMFCLWSIYKPIKYLAIPMIVSGVMFAILGSMNNFINDYVISNLEGLKPLISPLITILLTVIFKNGVLISFSGIFLLIIYVVINRIVINSHKTK